MLLQFDKRYFSGLTLPGSYVFSVIAGAILPVFMRGRGGGPYLSAVGGSEMALWDLAGRAMDVPV